ncbi:MAG: hypothetical protein Q8L88_02670 [Bacteroidota bacterium]|nr:hypothetical protein [Bacteroidota bacterium]
MKKKINAVEMVRKIRDANYEIIKDMKPDEVIAYFQKSSDEFHKSLKKVAEPKAKYRTSKS